MYGTLDAAENDQDAAEVHRMLDVRAPLDSGHSVGQGAGKLRGYWSGCWMLQRTLDTAKNAQDAVEDARCCRGQWTLDRTRDRFLDAA